MIGIEHEAYHVREGDEYVEVCAILVGGIPTEHAKINLTTWDGGAAGMLYFNLTCIHSMQLCIK